MNTRQIEEVSALDPRAMRLVARYIAELGERLGEFDPARSVSADPEEMSPPNGAFVISLVDGVAVACGGLKRFDRETGELKRMFVANEVRRAGHGRAILNALEAKAKALGYRALVLDTAAPLDEAVALYEANGYASVAAYNDNPYAARWFRKRLEPQF